MILDADQIEALELVAAHGRRLEIARRMVEEALADVQRAALAADLSGAPRSRIARAAGVERSSLYHWLDQADDQHKAAPATVATSGRLTHRKDGSDEREGS